MWWKRLTSISIADVLALLHEDWLPDEKKEQIKNMIIDTIEMATDLTNKMKKDLR